MAFAARNLHQPLTLFIVKRRADSGGGQSLSSGLFNSARFVVDLLRAEGHRAKLVEAVDGNSIDALVAANRPARVVLEAVWVTPAKLAELKRLHPAVRWTVRVHSETPFLANEGMSVAWLRELVTMGVELGFNSARSAVDFQTLAPTLHLPNYYPLCRPRRVKPAGSTIDVGCFGAIRPLKNQLIQALAALTYARHTGQALRFHMNGGRVEQQGINNLKNIQALFSGTASLILHPWLEHEDFVELVSMMDVCLQVSLSESFCIVAADAVSLGVPLVGSEAITWLPARSVADVASAASIVAAMKKADAITVELNQEALRNYLSFSRAAWCDWVEG